MVWPAAFADPGDENGVVGRGVRVVAAGVTAELGVPVVAIRGQVALAGRVADDGRLDAAHRFPVAAASFAASCAR